MSDETRWPTEQEILAQTCTLCGAPARQMCRGIDVDGGNYCHEVRMRAAREATTYVPSEDDVAAAVERIKSRLAWASLHWDTDKVHPDAWEHIARAALGEPTQEFLDSRVAPRVDQIEWGVDMGSGAGVWTAPDETSARIAADRSWRRLVQRKVTSWEEVKP